MKQFIKKLGSRKFLLTVASNGLAIAQVISGTGGKVGTIASCSVAVLTTIVYIIVEGKLDAKAIALALGVTAVETIKNSVESEEK